MDPPTTTANPWWPLLNPPWTSLRWDTHLCAGNHRGRHLKWFLASHWISLVWHLVFFQLPCLYFLTSALCSLSAGEKVTAGENPTRPDFAASKENWEKIWALLRFPVSTVFWNNLIGVGVLTREVGRTSPTLTSKSKMAALWLNTYERCRI